MARVEIPFVVQDSTGLPKSGASIQINLRGTGGTPATIYAQEEGTDQLSNPLTTTANGRVDGWLEEGRYSIVVSGAGITTYTQHWDAVSGGSNTRRGDVAIGNLGPAQQGAVVLGPNPGDWTLYRQATGEARATGSLIIDGSARIGQTRLIGTPSSLHLQDSSGAGLDKTGLVANTFTDNINAIRKELGSVANNDAVLMGFGAILRRLGISAAGVIVGNLAAGALPVPTADSLRIEYSGGRDTLHLTSTTGETGITLGGDVELYRQQANVLTTPDTLNVAALQVGGTALASTHLSDTANIARLDSTQTFTGAKTFTGGLLASGAASSFPITAQRTGDTTPRFAIGDDGAIEIGPGNAARDIRIYRSSADNIRTPDHINSDANVIAGLGGTGQTRIGGVGPGGVAGITAGSGNDLNLYRNAADQWRTDDALYVAQELRAHDGAAGQVRIGAVGPSGQAGLVVGSTNPANLYLSAASTLRTDNNIVIAGNLTVLGTTTQSATQTSAGALTAATGDVGQVKIGNPGGDPTIYFGPDDGVSIRKSATDMLRTADSFTIDGALAVNGGALFESTASFRKATAGDELVTFQVGAVNRARVLGDGTIEWATTGGVFDVNFGRSASGILRTTGIINAVGGFQVNGATLASTHLSDTAALARLASPTFTGTLTAPTVDVTTKLEIPAGAAGTPSLAFDSDPDTGIYSPGGDQFAIATAGSARLTISAAGAVNVPGALTQGGVAVILANDARLTDVRAPTGPAGGHLSGTYPNPSVANAVISNAHIANDAAIADTKLATISTAGKVADTAIPATIARLASPTFTGNPGVTGAPPAAGTNTTQIATTAFVVSHRGSATPLINGVAAAGTSNLWAREDHVHPVDTSRAAASHTHAIGDVTGLAASLALLAPLSNPTFTGTVTTPNLAHTGTTLGFFSKTPVAQPAAYTFSDSSVSSTRTLPDGFTPDQLAGLVKQLYEDLKALGLIA